MKKKGKQTLTPKLRFPDFREAGEWKSDLIAGVATISKGRSISKADVAKDGITPCIRYAELYTLYGEVINEVRSRTNIPLGELVLSQAEDDIDGVLYTRIVNLLSRGNYSLYEPREMMDENKEHFRRILHGFTERYPFNPALFPGESEEVLTS